MRKITAAALFLCLLSAHAFCEENIGRYIYSVFSENFNGVKISFDEWKGQGDREEAYDPASWDYAQHWPATYGTGGWYNVSEQTYSDRTAPKTGIDGNKYWQHDIFVPGSGRSAWTLVNFVDGTVSPTTPTSRNMSAYSGGTLEFWARSSSASAGSLKVGFKAANANRVVTLASMGFTPNGTWQKIVINLNSLYSSLTTVNAPFLTVLEYVTSATGIIIDFDCIVWRKPSGGSLDVNVKNISDNSPATEIVWSHSALGKRWVAAEQYLELDLDVLPDDNEQWGIQIYTDNTSATASPRYSGNLDSSMASGLVSSSDTTKMLPMAWRASDKVFPYEGKFKVNPVAYYDDFDKTLIIKANNGGIYDGGTDDPGAEGYYCWFAMKDKAMFSLGDPDVTSRADYLKIWDNRGFHAAPGPVEYWGMSPGAMINMKIAPKIYLAADFGTATTPNTYQTNAIIIELFYE